MVKKIVLVVIGLLLVVGILVSFAFFLLRPISLSPGEIKLTEDKLITNQTLIELIIKNMTSPSGNSLDIIVSDEDDVNIINDSWKISYYACNKNEHTGWIYYFDGKSEPKLYGPYGWCLI